MRSCALRAGSRSVRMRSRTVREPRPRNRTGSCALRVGSRNVGPRSRIPQGPHQACGPLGACVRGRYDIRTVQELLGHGDVTATMIYTPVLNRGERGVESPADRFLAGYRSPVSPPAAGGLKSDAGDHASAQALDNEGKDTLASSSVQNDRPHSCGAVRSRDWYV